MTRQSIIRKINSDNSFSFKLETEFDKELKEKYAEFKAKLDYQFFKPILRKQLQTALLIEQSTIPPYLTAMYSIKDGTNSLAVQLIRSVVVEEMLHMIMVCNVMNALDLKPTVNREENYPRYPSKLPLNVDFFVNLEKFSNNSISNFIAIEQPDCSDVKAPVTSQSNKEQDNKIKGIKGGDLTNLIIEKIMSEIDSIEKELKTIGDFYKFLLKLIELVQFFSQENIVQKNTQLQITPEQYYGSGGKLIVVQSIEDIHLVFEEIMDQGEGALVDGQSTMYDKDISQFGEGYELAHYFRFKEILHEHYYIGGSYSEFVIDDNGNIPITTPPNGKPLEVDWDAVYPIKTNAKITDYIDNPTLLAQAKEFNKTYKRLLDAIQSAIEGRQGELGKSVMYMHALKEQAVGLMRQPLSSQVNAAPTFEYINL